MHWCSVVVLYVLVLFRVAFRVPLAVMLYVPILRSCGVLLCDVNTLPGNVLLVMCCVLIMYSVFTDLELVFDLH